MEITNNLRNIETRHVRIDYDEAIFSKKQFLTSELNLLYILKRMQNYKVLRKKELTAKQKLKNQLSSLRIKFNNFIFTIPKHEIPLIKNRNKKYISKENSTLEDDLNDIKRKLAELQ